MLTGLCEHFSGIAGLVITVCGSPFPKPLAKSLIFYLVSGAIISCMIFLKRRNQGNEDETESMVDD